MPWPTLDRPEVEERVRQALVESPPRAVFVRGTSGIGKTTIARRIADRRQREGAAVLGIVGLAELHDAPLAPFVPLLPSLGLRYRESDGLTARDLIANIGARARTTLLVVDDAPLLDRASAAVVHQVVSAFAVPTVMTGRSEHGLHGPLERLATENRITTIDVEGLDRLQIAELLRRHFGATVRPDDVSRLHEQVGGNPLHLRELVQLAERRDLVRRVGAGVELEAVALPRDPRTPIADRLAGLTSEALTVMRLVSLGASAPRSLLLPTAREQVLAQELVRRGLLELRPRDILRVSHPSFAEVALADLSGPDREAFIGTVASRLSSGGDDLRFTAIQLMCNTAEGPTRIDLDWAVRRAFAMGQHLVAHELAQRRRTGWPDRDPPFGTAVDEATALSALDRQLEADDAFERAEQVAQSAADRALLISRWGTHLAYRRFDIDAALAVAQRLSDGLDEGNRALLEPEIGTWRILAGETPTRSGHAADPDVSPEVAIRGAISAVMLDSMGGQVNSQAADVLIRLERNLGILDPFAAAMVHIQRYFMLLSRGEGEAAARVCEEQRAVCTPDAAGMWSLTLGIHRMYGGRLADALALAELAVEQLRWRDPLGFLGFAVALQANVAAQLGHAEPAEELLAGLVPSQLADPKTAMQAAEARAFLAAREGAQPEAAAVVAAAAQAAVDAGHDLVAAISLSVCLRLGQADVAAGPLAEIRARVGEGLGLYEALADLAAALADGRPDGVRREARRVADAGMEATAIDALRLAERMPGVRTTRTTRTTRTHSELLRKLERLRREIQQRSGPSMDRSSPAGALTEREWQVVDLACQRLSSREIADALGVSVRTVDNHLSRAYRKLAVSGRSELRTLFADSGPD